MNIGKLLSVGFAPVTSVETWTYRSSRLDDVIGKYMPWERSAPARTDTPDRKVAKPRIFTSRHSDDLTVRAAQLGIFR